MVRSVATLNPDRRGAPLGHKGPGLHRHDIARAHARSTVCAMTPNAQVIATLAAYVPRGLPAGAWALAATPVRSLAARTAPHDPARARGVA